MRPTNMATSGSPTTTRAVRPLHVATSILGHCHSSACVEVGRTRVICAVRPPQQLIHEYRGQRGRVSCTVVRASTGAAAITTGTSDAGDGSAERDLALALEGVAEQLVMLDKMPQLLVEVIVEINSDADGAVLDAASTAMSAALAVGGIEMYDCFSASSAGLLADGSIAVDLLAEEEKSAQVVVRVCTALNAGTTTYLSHRGMCELTTMAELADKATQAIQVRREHILQQLRPHTAATSKTGTATPKKK